MKAARRFAVAAASGVALAGGLGLTGGASRYDDRSADVEWSYTPVSRPPVPEVQDPAWVRGDIDAFILASMEAAGLEPATETDRRTLIRRATYDLTGLPPTIEEVEAFIADEREDAYERLVDRLLASPQYGVKWGRHWLDLVRWAETDSYERDRVKPAAWRYRDWVIDAFNADMPYDRFITLQLAGDELPDTGIGQHIATGFLHLGIRDDEPTDPLQAVYDDLDGMLDTTSRVMLGMSMGCARCHDHKKDPIPTADYYRMLAFFEGLKPYKIGGGNGINTESFVRMIPSDLGTAAWEDQMESWRRERTERLAEVRNLVEEVRVRWGNDALREAESTIAAGQTLHLSFDDIEAIPGDARGIDAVPGRIGGAARFDSDDRVVIRRTVAESFTISFWFRAEEPGEGGEEDLRWFRGSGLVDAEVSGIVDDFGVALIGGHVTAGVGRPETFIAGPGGTADGDWHHVAFTRDQESGRIALWLDGVLVDEATGGNQPLTATNSVVIGRSHEDRATFRGDIDEVRFWDRPLGPSEILNLAIDGGALEAHVRLVAERLGEAEAARLSAAITRLGELRRPDREMVQVLAAQEVEKPPESFIRVRGTASALGDPVSAGFPAVLGGGSPAVEPPADGETSGRRLALARWMASADNPRTARVIANRLWQHHFGRGIVPTPNEFGVLGEPPTHPELLDWLAAELVDGGWRLKRMHKLLMTSNAYRMSGGASQEALEADPVNRLFSRFNPRRLTAEEFRDSILAVNGTLNLEMGGPGVYPEMPEEVLATASRPNEAWGRSSEEDAARRSVYIHVKRSLLMPMLESFDLADTDSSCPVRFTTTQPTQALTLINSDFTNEQAAILGSRLHDETGGQIESVVRRGLRLAVLREPSDEEVEQGVNLISELRDSEGLSEADAVSLFCLVLLNLNEFMYID